MLRRAWLVGRLLLFPTIALGVALAIAPSRAALEVHVWLLVVLAFALLAFLGVVAGAYARGPSPFDASLVRHPEPLQRPSSLARLEREVSMAGTAAFDVHFRLRPTVTELASELLFARRGIDMRRDPAAARAVLGDEAWALVEPDRQTPTDRHAAGIDEAEAERILTALERI
jgi:hypothetical protein